MKLVLILLIGLLVSANKKNEPTKKYEVLDLSKQATTNKNISVTANNNKPTKKDEV